MRTAAERIAALTAMAAEEEVGQLPLGLRKPITTEHELDALIDEWERERRERDRRRAA